MFRNSIIKLLWLGCVLLQPAASTAAQRLPLPVDQCAVHTPFGEPTFSKTKYPRIVKICREGYLTAYDTSSKIPLYVAWLITPDRVFGCVPRHDNFQADVSTPFSSTPQDYKSSGYDQGHMANNAHQSWSPEVQAESFLMTNMSPQLPAINRGPWKALETATGAWVFGLSVKFDVIAGNLYLNSTQKIGDGVVVPTHLYKVVINMSTGEYAGWVFPNTQISPDQPLTAFRASVKSIEQAAGVSLRTQRGMYELPVGKEWPTDLAGAAAAKKVTCPRRPPN